MSDPIPDDETPSPCPAVIDWDSDIDPNNPFLMADGSPRFITPDEHSLRRTSKTVTEAVLRQNQKA